MKATRSPAGTGCQVTLCGPVWHVISCSGVVIFEYELLYPIYFALLNNHYYNLQLMIIFQVQSTANVGFCSAALRLVVQKTAGKILVIRIK